MKFLTAEEREEWESMLTDAVGSADDGAKVTRRAADALKKLLLDAEQAQKKWAGMVFDEATLRGLQGIARSYMKRQSTVMMSHDGEVIGKASRVGIRRKQDDGSQVWQQTLFVDMTWDELAQWLGHIESQVSALLIDKAMVKKIQALRERVPESKGPGDACKKLGTTIKAVLAEDAAA